MERHKHESSVQDPAGPYSFIFLKANPISALQLYDLSIDRFTPIRWAESLYLVAKG